MPTEPGSFHESTRPSERENSADAADTMKQSRLRDRKQRPVVLIHPPAISRRYLNTKFMPYGMSVIYAYLRTHGVPAVQYDFLPEYLYGGSEDVDYHGGRRSFSEEDLLALLEHGSHHEELVPFTEKYGKRLPQNAAIYAFSLVGYHQFWAALLLARHLRQQNPNSIIVFGGPLVTIKPTHSLAQFGQADYWVKGGGEEPLRLIYERHELGKAIQRKNIPGIVYMQGERLVENSRSRMRADEEMSPDFTGLELSDYTYDHPVTGRDTLFLPYRTSKGCASGCSFCTGRLVDPYDVKSIDKVIHELSTMSSLYRTRSFMFSDSAINGHPRMLSRLSERLAETLPDIQWYAYAKINGFSKELLDQVRRAGCFSLFWGVESASQATVDLLGKGFRVEKIYELLDHSIRLGIKNYIHFIYNTPHETRADVEALIALIDHYIDSDLVRFLPHRFLLEPQSGMQRNPGKYGLENVLKSKTGLFEREHFRFDELHGPTYAEILKRNKAHEQMLQSRLKLAEEKNRPQTHQKQVPDGSLRETQEHISERDRGTQDSLDKNVRDSAHHNDKHFQELM